jgi:hypothetical protein
VAFNTTTASLKRTALMEIDLGSSTLRYADEPIVLSDDTYYDHRIISFPTIQLSLGRLLDPEFRRPAIVVVLDDSDGAISTLFEANDGFAGG